MTDKQIVRIKKKIRAYRARLAAEKRTWGIYDDSRGVRYVIPELYFKIKDYKGAMTYFRWFAKSFPDDIGYPDFNLLWSATLFENDKIPDAIKKAYETAFSNTYLLDLINGKKPLPLDKSETMGFEPIDYALEVYEDSIKLISLEFQIWISNLSETDEFKNNLNRFISLQKLIKDEHVGPMRTHLIQESDKFERLLTGRLRN